MARLREGCTFVFSVPHRFARLTDRLDYSNDAFYKPSNGLHHDIIIVRVLPRLPHPRLSFVASVLDVSRSYFRHFCSLDWLCTRTLLLCDEWSGPHAVGLGPGGTPSRGRRRRNLVAIGVSSPYSCTSRRIWAEEAGSAGRSRRSRCRRCSLRTRRRDQVTRTNFFRFERHRISRGKLSSSSVI